MRKTNCLFRNRIYGGPVGSNPNKARTRPDLGLHQPHERGTDAFNVVRSLNTARQLAGLRAVQQQESRTVRAHEMRKLDSFARAQELSNFAEPKSKAEHEFVQAQFEREMQLRPSASRFGSGSARKSGGSRDNARNSDGNNNNADVNADASDDSVPEFRPRRAPRMPSGLNVPTGPEALVRRRKTHMATNDAASNADGGNNDVDYNAQLHHVRVLQDGRHLERRVKYAQQPTAREFSSALRALNKSTLAEDEIERLQDRLVEEAGLYPTQRLDAFMLRDDGMFPEWVNELPVHLKDRVRYGGIGLTEDDEILRQNLAKMPADERAAEWARLKAAREYKQGTAERRVTSAETRQLRLGIRRHHQLYHRRLMRAALLKRLALREPDKFEAWPTRDVDYSARLSQVAQFVEAGVPTMGEWPLDLRKLENVRKKQRIAAVAEREFVRAGVALPNVGSSDRAAPLTSRIGDGVRRTLERLEDRERDVKRVSRKYYAARFTSIKQGDRDEHGRSFRDMARWVKHGRRGAFRSEDEMRTMDRQAVPRPNMMGFSYVKENTVQRSEHHYSEERRSGGLPRASEAPEALG